MFMTQHHALFNIFSKLFLFFLPSSQPPLRYIQTIHSHHENFMLYSIIFTAIFCHNFLLLFFISYKEKFWLRHLVILFIPKKMSQFTKAPLPTMQILFSHFMEDIIHLLPSHVFAIMTIFLGKYLCLCRCVFPIFH